MLERSLGNVGHVGYSLNLTPQRGFDQYKAPTLRLDNVNTGVENMEIQPTKRDQRKRCCIWSIESTHLAPHSSFDRWPLLSARTNWACAMSKSPRGESLQTWSLPSGYVHACLAGKSPKTYVDDCPHRSLSLGDQSRIFRSCNPQIPEVSPGLVLLETTSATKRNQGAPSCCIKPMNYSYIYHKP